MGEKAGVHARCSHCDYTRRFSPELGGRYYRCPKCRQGVIAVPRASAADEQRWRTSEDAWLQAALEDRPPKRPAPPQLSATDLDPGAPVHAKARGKPSDKRPAAAPPAAPAPTLPDSSGSADAPAARLVVPTSSADGEAPSSASGGASSGSGAPHDPSETPPLGGGAPRSPDEAAAPVHKGEVATVRKILVECGLCGFMVGIPPQFFGKTVHCPSCAGDTVFSESTLEPVKDELFDRMALETAERAVLFKPPGASRWSTFRAFLIGVGLGLVAIAGLWGVVVQRRTTARRAATEQAETDGWRYGLGDDGQLHEPWCRENVIPAQKLTQTQAGASGKRLHECY